MWQALNPGYTKTKKKKLQVNAGDGEKQQQPIKVQDDRCSN